MPAAERRQEHPGARLTFTSRRDNWPDTGVLLDPKGS